MDSVYELVDELLSTINKLQKALDNVDKELGDLQGKLNDALEENQMLRDNEDDEDPMDRSDFI